MDRSRKAVFGKAPSLKLEQLLTNITLPATGLYKLRLEYGIAVTKQELIPYTPRAINSLQVVDADGFAYGKKFADRTGIRNCLEKKNECDDIIMVQHGYITDTSYANIALFDGRHWYTPAWPMLPGTRRAQLLDLEVIRPSIIRAKDLVNFKKIRLMNAMLPWEEAPTLDCSVISY